MSSARFPGKVLAPLRGRAVIDHVLDRVDPTLRPVVATSDDTSDDPLVAHLKVRGVETHRGPLNDVFARFQGCLREYPCPWFIRISADSPLLDPQVVRRIAAYADRRDLDLVTNVFPRTFPRGRSVEMVRAESFAAVDGAMLTPDEREHVTKYFYNHPGQFRILNVESGDPAQASTNLCVDTPEDLRRLETICS